MCTSGIIYIYIYIYNNHLYVSATHVALLREVAGKIKIKILYKPTKPIKHIK